MKIKKIEAQPAVVKKLRVAAYCRVSTENEDQKESLEAQREHYDARACSMISASAAQRRMPVKACRLCYTPAVPEASIMC